MVSRTAASHTTDWVCGVSDCWQGCVCGIVAAVVTPWHSTAEGIKNCAFDVKGVFETNAEAVSHK